MAPSSLPKRPWTLLTIMWRTVNDAVEWALSIFQVWAAAGAARATTAAAARAKRFNMDCS